LRYVYLLVGVLAVRQPAKCVPVALSLSGKTSFESTPYNGFEGANVETIFLLCSLLDVLSGDNNLNFDYEEDILDCNYSWDSCFFTLTYLELSK